MLKVLKPDKKHVNITLDKITFQIAQTVRAIVDIGKIYKMSQKRTEPL